MDVTFQLVVLGKTGMYTYGNRAATRELAKLAKGNLIRQACDEPMRRLGIERTDWEGTKAVRTVLLDAETTPGEWTIGS